MGKIRMLVAGLLAFTACGGERDNDRIAADSARAVEDAAAAVSLLSPIRAVSMAEVEYGQLAAQRAVTPDIRQYAQTIATDHRSLIAVLDSVAQQRDTSLAESDEALELENTVRMAHSGLENLQGPDFSLPFIRAEVESHRQLLDRLDLQLIPGATNPDMKTLLDDIRAMVDAHLTRARQLLAQQLGESPVPQQPATPPQPRVQPPAPRDTTRRDTTRPDTIRPDTIRPDTIARR